MKTLRNRIKSDFTQVPNQIINDPTISWKAVGIFNYLLSKPEGWQFYKTDIQNHGTEGDTALSSGLKELEDAGYLVRNKIKDEQGQFSGWDWILQLPDTPKTTVSGEEPDTKETPISGKPDSRETPAYNNTYSNKTDLLSNTDDIPSDSESESESESVPISDQAEKIYQIYPRKVGKKKAIEKIKKALKEIPFKELKPIVELYAESVDGKETKYIPHPQTWFNQGRWEDDPAEWVAWKKSNQKTKTKGDKDAELTKHILSNYGRN